MLRLYLNIGAYNGSGSFPSGEYRFSVPMGAENYPVDFITNIRSGYNQITICHTTSGQIGSTALIDSPAIFDLTEMFGATIAQWMLDNDDKGIAILKQMLSDDIYPYTPTPQIVSAKPEAHIMKDADGTVIGNYPLGGVELRGVPVLGTDSIHYEGDTYAPDGTVTRRFNQIDLGEVTWTVTNSTNGVLRMTGGYGTGKGPKYQGWCFSDGYEYTKGGAYASMPDKSIRIGNSSSVPIFWLKDSDFIGKTASEAQALLLGKTAIYEIKTPYTETAEPYDAVQICDPNGMEEYADSRTNRIPVGHVTQYPEDQVAKLDRIPRDVPSKQSIAPVEDGYTASQAYTTGKAFWVGDTFYRATTNISSGATITPNTNCVETNLVDYILYTIENS